MTAIRLTLSDELELAGNDTDTGRVERPSGFQRMGSAAAETATLRSCGRWAVVEQFVRDGYRYRLMRRPLELESAPSRLTRREREVVALALEGHSNKSIAYALGVSPSTIGVLIFRAAAKMGVKSRAELLSVLGRAFSIDDA